ncbi:MATE family efflux transporter [Paenibacillus senegalensis]|uniref:MATE family efflux transporter n=1 Tax=Paenibacillus senegalensis TaxID=1465766 RepID=UPI00028976E0|nr:MATE family efflux transporter [Paenibacillus senegalensis]
MYHAENWKQKLILFLHVLWPILVVQVGYMAMNLVDTMMSGRAGTDDLAGVAIGSSLWMPISIGLNGIMLAVTPIVAQLYGKGDRSRITFSVTQALYLAVVISLIIIGIGSQTLENILQIMGLAPEVHYIAKHYLIGLSIGIVPLFMANVLRYFFDAQGLTKITMVILLMAIPFNMLLNYLLIFGKLGFPRLGGIGAGYTTGFTYWVILFFSIWMTFKLDAIRPYRLFTTWITPSWKAWKKQLAIGVPMGLSIFFEASIFSAVTLLMGKLFDTTTIAAHQAASTFTNLLFMVPLSISMALTIFVAYELGSGRRTAALHYTRLGVGGALAIMTICAVALYFVREPVAWIYTDDPAVVTLIKSFLIFAMIYQLSDASQAALQGVLRGYKDTTIPFIIALISYWAIGIPSGFWLAVNTRLGPYGFWVGITLGLTCAALGFAVRLLQVQRKFRSKTIKAAS